MQLTIRQAAGYLGVNDATVRGWINERGLPVHRANERYYLNSVELWEWAMEHDVPVSRSLLDHSRRAPDDVPPMSELLRAGGILYDLTATDRHGVLREFLGQLPLPPEQDRDTLMSVLEAREEMGSTGIGGGIAIPHVRNPILLHLDHAFVTLALLTHPVEFGALDGKPVHALFMVVSPTVPVHLRVLAQLGFLLRDETLRDMLRRRAAPEEILGRVEMLEATLTTGAFAARKS